MIKLVTAAVFIVLFVGCSCDVLPGVKLPYQELVEAKKFIKEAVKKDKIVVFGKSYCPFSNYTKALLKFYNVDFKAYDIDRMNEGKAIQENMKFLIGSGTVPKIYFKGSLLGGANDLYQMNLSGKLYSMLKGKDRNFNAKN